MSPSESSISVASPLSFTRLEPNLGVAPSRAADAVVPVIPSTGLLAPARPFELFHLALWSAIAALLVIMFGSFVLQLL